MTAEELWQEYCLKKNMAIDTPYEAWAFCGGKKEGDELAKLVVERKKFGTASLYDEYVIEDALDELPHIGDISVILDSSDNAVCVIKNYDVYTRAFGDVSPFHGYSEGEGDRSLTYWRNIHKEVFSPALEEIGLKLTDEAIIICEKFSVEYVPGKAPVPEDDLIYIEPTMEYAKEIEAYRQEMLDAGSSFDGCFSMKRLADTSEYVDSCISWSNPRRPADEHGAWGNVLMCFRKSDMKMIGCLQVHNVLTERMEKYTGHVGYSVRPSERQKGYATLMLAKAKDFLSAFGFKKIIVSCLIDNEASRKTILANGGVLLDTFYLSDDNVTLEKYEIIL